MNGFAAPGLRHRLLQRIDSWRPLLQHRILGRFIPRRFISHWVLPLIVPGKRSRYRAGDYWNEWYSSAASCNDGVTIGPGADPLATRYHYNSVENSIIRYFIFSRAPKDPCVLDIGSGAGHWIDFYRAVLGARSVVGIDIAAPCVDALRREYADVGNVVIKQADIAGPNFELGLRFHVINAIGVMFHIVDDVLWKRALYNLATHLHERGTIVIGGHFGWITQDVQFGGSDPNNPAVNKRVRSLRLWKAAAAEAGLEVCGLNRTPRASGISTPQNDVLFLRLTR